jgi:hypothetical protein
MAGKVSRVRRGRTKVVAQMSGGKVVHRLVAQRPRKSYTPRGVQKTALHRRFVADMAAGDFDPMYQNSAATIRSGHDAAYQGMKSRGQLPFQRRGKARKGRNNSAIVRKAWRTRRQRTTFH